MILHYADRLSVPKIAEALVTTLPKVNRYIDKALTFGPEAALSEEQRSGRPAVVTPEAKAWVISLACQKRKELGGSKSGYAAFEAEPVCNHPFVVVLFLFIVLAWHVNRLYG
ncbi:hypothetical protein [Paenibacillus elgii]|uniref:hypothetical protein n=1 Tax=Paenibacillus elgii TaxID=189691 RepID=UPI0030D8EA8A